MVPLCKRRRPMIRRGFNYIPSILTRNLAMSGETVLDNSIESAIKRKLTSKFNPTYLRVINESHMHNVARGSETHFKVIVVSEYFNEAYLLQRHRMINDLLRNEFENGIHALTIIAKTPTEWNADHRIRPSPPCIGAVK